MESVLDPVLVGVVAGVVYALHGYHGVLGHHKGVFVYGGLHVAQGTPPYERSRDGVLAEPI